MWIKFKDVRHIEMPKAAQKVHLSFSKTRDEIEMKSAKYCEVAFEDFLVAAWAFRYVSLPKSH